MNKEQGEQAEHCIFNNPGFKLLSLTYTLTTNSDVAQKYTHWHILFVLLNYLVSLQILVFKI